MHKGYVSYSIDNSGLERISVYKDFNMRVSVVSDGENIKSISFETPQLRKDVSLGDETLNMLRELEGGEQLCELEKENLEQALNIYHEVKKILDVDEKLKDYKPRFSHVSEFSLYNVLGIDDASEIKSLIEKVNEKDSKY